MSYDADALATPGLVAAWRLNDTAGSTTLADAGPNSYPLTLTAAKVDAPENTAGLGSSTRITGTVTASRTAASSAALQPTSAVSILATVTINSLFPSGEATYIPLVGRANNWQLRLRPDGSVALWVATTAGTISTQTPPLLTTGKTYMLAMTFSGRTARLFINGRSVLSKTLVGTIANTITDPIVVGGGAASLSVDLAGVYVYNTALTPGQIRGLYLSGTKTTPAADNINYDNVYDSSSALIASAGASIRCVTCGGARRANEPTITTAAGPHHPGCYGMIGAATPATAITAASSQADIVAMTQRLMWDSFHNYTDPVTDTTKTTTFDGSLLQPFNTIFAIEIQFGFFAALAILIRHQGLPANHWAVKACSDAVERFIASQSTVGGWQYPTNLNPNNLGPTNDFSMAVFGETILYLRDKVPAATYGRWVASLEAGANYMLTQPPGAPEFGYYVNGNREAQELAGYWWTWRLTGKQKWLDTYNAQFDFLNAPPVGARSQYPAPASDHYGLVLVTAPTRVDGADGKGYIIERDPGHAPPTYNQTGYDGWDPNYLQLCTGFLTRLWLANRDPRVLRLMNLHVNMIIDPTIGRLNRSTWVLNGVGGSRQNNNSIFSPGVAFALAWQAGSTTFSAADLAGIWQANSDTFTNAYGSPSPGIYGAINRDLGSIIQASSLWPGLPT